MKFLLQPWQILLLVLAGWINKHQQKAIEYLIVENRVLREKIGKKKDSVKRRAMPLRVVSLPFRSASWIDGGLFPCRNGFAYLANIRAQNQSSAPGEVRYPE